MGLTTNETLAGFTAVIAVAKLASAVWLIFNIRNLARATRRKQDSSLVQLILYRESVRITAGACLAFTGVAITTLMRLPLRAMREAGNAALGEKWLDYTIWWEAPCSLLIVAGMVLIMWSALCKMSSKWMAVTTVIAGVMLTFFAGVTISDMLAALFHS